MWRDVAGRYDKAGHRQCFPTCGSPLTHSVGGGREDPRIPQRYEASGHHACEGQFFVLDRFC